MADFETERRRDAYKTTTSNIVTLMAIAVAVLYLLSFVHRFFWFAAIVIAVIGFAIWWCRLYVLHDSGRFS